MKATFLPITRILVLLGLLIFIAIGSTIGFYFLRDSSPGSDSPTSRPPEYTLTVIPLTAPLASSNAEISGLAWYGDHLILLPQYPSRMSDQANGAIFALPRQAILDFLDGKHQPPLEPIAIPLSSGGVEETIPGFEGFEALDFTGEQAFLTIEAKQGSEMQGYVIAGRISSNLSELRLDPGSLSRNPPQTAFANHTDEALLLVDNQILILHEINGAALNLQPHGTFFSRTLQPAGIIPLPNLEYRLTDASELDANSNFWVINYFFPGDVGLKPASDPLADRYGQGITHDRQESVERLVQLHYSPNGITLTQTPPIQLILMDGESRNWEGLASLEGHGFLLATDKYPETILAFIHYPRE